MKEWSNWSGSAIAHPERHVAVRSEEDLSTLIKDSAGVLRMVGSGHSFSPIAAIDQGTLVSLGGFDSVNEAAPGHARIGAGGQLGAISTRLHGMGHAFANMGDINDQTLGGALATATHGTGLQFGCYSSMLTELTLMDGRGEKRVLSRNAEADLFRALAVGIGTGGVVTEAVMQTAKPYRLDRARYAIALEDMLDDFTARMSARRNVEFYYITGSGQAVVMESDASDAAPIARPEDRDQEGLAQLRLAGRLLGWAPWLHRFVLSRIIRSHSHEHFIEDWHRAFPTDREGIRFNETEYHLPLEVGPQALREVVALVEKQFPHVYFPMEVRTVAADDLSLSPFYQRDSLSIAVHHEAGQPFQALMQAVETVFHKYEGRPHWGKMHSLTATELRGLYPAWDMAIEARREMDPDNRFVTPYMARLLGL
ncbi:D-arabinono-1,4-lactone oxidase [Shimia sediminis]|uniref:D-arabinono-1,4-lactone oxidase n=1 Tax=Shimia sediminis TaxID=2497945 RepID=UPI000F8E14F5|nr:D-arabinono-1,4-lactone oxidase [Shimia sediminis]